MQIVEARIRKLTGEVVWDGLVQIVNEVLESRWGQLMRRVVNEQVQMVEARLWVTLEGVVWGAVRIVSEVASLVEGPFEAIAGIVETASEQVRSVESFIAGLAQGLIEVIDDAVSLVHGAISRLGYPLVQVIADAVGLADSLATRIRRVYAQAVKRNPFFRRRFMRRR